MNHIETFIVSSGTTTTRVIFSVVTVFVSALWWWWWRRHTTANKNEKRIDHDGIFVPPVGPAFADLAHCLRAENQIETMQRYGSIVAVPSPLPGVIPHQIITTDIAILKELCIKQQNQYREPCNFTTRVDAFCQATQQVVGVGVTSLKGDEWKWRKQALLKEFHRSKLLSDTRGLVTKIVQAGQEMCETLHEAASNGRNEPIAVDHVTTKAAVSVILYFLFGRDLTFDTEQMRLAAHDLMACLGLRLFHPFYKLYQYIPGTLPFQMERRKRRAWQIIDAIVAPEIQLLLDEHVGGKRPMDDTAERPPRKPGSVLASLLEHEPRFVQGGVSGMIAEARVFVQAGKWTMHCPCLIVFPFNRSTANSQPSSLFFAGFETTAHSLAFCMGMMAERPDLADTMAALGQRLFVNNNNKKKRDLYNVETILKSLDDTADDSAMTLIKNFFLESVRLYPLAPALGGACTQDVTVTTSSGQTVHFKKGTAVTFPNVPLQRQLDDRPHVIIPERWNVPNNQQQPFLHTFQTGAHACPGRPLSTLEANVFLLLICTQFEFSFPPENRDCKVEYEDNLLLRPKNGMPLVVKKREWCNK
jgi:cytochrome P450